jgi:hypothetical protein
MPFTHFYFPNLVGGRYLSLFLGPGCQKSVVWEMSEPCSRMHRFDRESNRIQTPGTLVETWSAGSSIYLSIYLSICLSNFSCRWPMEIPSRFPRLAISHLVRWEYETGLSFLFFCEDWNFPGLRKRAGNLCMACVISQASMRERLSDGWFHESWRSQTRLLDRTISWVMTGSFYQPITHKATTTSSKYLICGV